jgi:hypothetical protein
MPAAAPLDVPGLTPGDRVQHELLVRERAEKKTSAGDPFVVLKLGNRSGAIDTAPIWSDKLEWAAGADPGAWCRSSATWRSTGATAPPSGSSP